MKTAEIGRMLRKISAQLEELERRALPVSMNPIYMNISEAANFIRVAKSTLYTWICKRKVPFTRLGGKVVFEKRELILWIEGSRVPVREEWNTQFPTANIRT